MTTTRFQYNTVRIDQATTAGVVYVVRVTDEGFWLVSKIATGSEPITIKVANRTNNPNIPTHTQAIANLATLTYSDWSDVF